MKIELVNGAILKDGEQIGTYNAETNTVHCPHRISPALYGPIKDAIGQKPTYDFGAPNQPAHSPEPPKPSASEPPAAAPVSEPTDPATPPVEKPADSVEATKPPATTKPVTKLPPLPEPPQDPEYGDKTPAWARWLRATDPEAFEKRFAGRTLNID